MMKALQNIILFSSLFFIATAAIAEEVAEHTEDHIPLDKIGWQAANLGILLIIIYFGIKKSIVETFAKRQQDFLEQSEKTKVLLLAAESELKEIKSKLALLEGSENKAIESAKHEASLVNATLIKDAEAQAVQIKKDAELTIHAELAKAKHEINTILLNQAIVVAKDKLAAAGDTTKLIEAQFLAQVDNAQTAKASL